MALRVTGRDGENIYLCMSNSLDQPRSERGQLYIGDTYFGNPGASKIIGYDHTRFLIAKMLAPDVPESPYLSEDIALLTGRLSDWIYYWIASLKASLR